MLLIIYKIEIIYFTGAVMQFNIYKNVLVLAVGGGNDSVSTLLLQLQLHKKFGYSPNSIDIVAVLPDCLDYQNLTPTNHPVVGLISESTTRSVQGYEMKAFPERILAQNKNIFPELPVKQVFGISMSQGSTGVAHALKYLVTKNNYDLILAIDVGGDFVAHKDNLDVLSPMMDGYMLYALKNLQQFIKSSQLSTELIFSIFGLGTDGESTPDMLEKSLSLLPELEQYSFNKDDIAQFVSFYRDTVEKNRYSRTTDYTLLEITETGHDNPSNFRGRFHVKIHPTEKSQVYYGNFSHYQDEKFFGKFYLFKNIDQVDNIYSQEASNGIEWFLKVQSEKDKINHELNGQSYSNIGKVLNDKNLDNKSLFFGTPSRKFTAQQQIDIAKDISKSVLYGIYDYAIIYKSYKDYMDNHLYVDDITDDLSIVSSTLENLLLIKSNFYFNN